MTGQELSLARLRATGAGDAADGGQVVIFGRKPGLAGGILALLLAIFVPAGIIATPMLGDRMPNLRV